MAAKVGKIEKELKGPDQFVSFWGEVGKKVGERRREILIATIALLVVALGMWATRSFTSSRAEKATQDFARIYRVASTPIAAEGAPPATDGGPRFQNERERSEAALRETDAFLSAHGGSSLRDEANLLKARLLVTLGRAPEAIELYKGLRADVDKSLAFVADEGLAYAQEAAGQVDAAIATLDGLAEASKSAGNFFRDRALFHKAQLLEGKGQAKDAQKLYRDILAEMPTTSLKEEINHRIAGLESK